MPIEKQKNVLKLTNAKNLGMSSIVKESMTAFTSKGVDLGKTMFKVNRRRPMHKIVNIKNKISNSVLELHKNRNVGHIVL